MSSLTADPPPAEATSASSDGGAVRWIIGTLIGAVVVGALAGLLWWQLVTPAYFERVGNDVVMGQRELGQRFAQDGWFMTIGFAGSLIAGLGVLRWRRRTPTLAVLVVVAAAAVAAVVCWRVGVHLGHVSVAERARHAANGGHIPDSLHLLSKLALLAWPAGAAMGATMYLFGRSASYDEPLNGLDPYESGHNGLGQNPESPRQSG